jgi:serpin B
MVKAMVNLSRRSMRAASLLVALPMLAMACNGSDSGPGPGPGPGPGQELRSDKIRVVDPSVPAEDAAALAQGNLQFAVDMHARLRAKNTGNFIFSQSSISIALAMLYAGAANNTAAQMASALHFTLPAERLHPAFNALDAALTTATPGADASAFRLKIANATWTQNGFPVLPSYLDTLALNYGAGIFTDDFGGDAEGARGRVNGWVSDQTEHQIPELFPQGTINSDTVLVLANAVFFHGDWKQPFDPNSPTGTFHAPGSDVSVPMMHGLHNGKLWNGEGWEAGSLAYKGDTTSMIVVVPDAGTFDAFEQGLTAAQLTAILASSGSGGGGDVVMPRFKFETPTSLNEILAQMGMTDVFSSAADLSGIDGRRDLAVQYVVHKATIAVDEKGTTASAATGVSVGPTSIPQVLAVDRPFLFFIRHEPTGAILFQGRVLDPSK